MLRIHVYFNNGCEIECANVVNSRAFWRTISKWCKRNDHARVIRVVKERDPE